MATIEQGGINLTSSTVIGVNILPYSIVGNGQTIVGTAGTAVPLTTSTAVKTITVKALNTNGGIIYVGSSSVSSLNGLILKASESISLDLDNLSKVYIDSSVNGEGVSYIYLS